jgi:hypothetical protein
VELLLPQAFRQTALQVASLSAALPWVLVRGYLAQEHSFLRWNAIGFSLVAIPLLVSSLASAGAVHASLAIALTRISRSFASNDSKIDLTLQVGFLTFGVIPSSITAPFSFSYQV